VGLLLASEAARLYDRLSEPAMARLDACLASGLQGEGCLIALFHLLRTASLQRSRGFEVAFTGLEDGSPFDLLIASGGVEAEVACAKRTAVSGSMSRQSATAKPASKASPQPQVQRTATSKAGVLKCVPSLWW